MPTIEINGKKIEAEAGSMIIEVADKVGFQIPRFCYHKKLSVAANCRMCLVDVEKAPKTLPACATPVAEGMKIWTQSPKALMAQKAVMEFLLINHPLDCPVCDQGGECELQDVAMGYGRNNSEYKEGKRSILDKDIGPLIATDMTRCIQCTRCVRFGTEVAGVRELGATGRGEHLEITTFIEKNVESEVSGNIIDLCPVGALTSKPYRFTARAWELTQKTSIAPHDCLGSNIYVHSRRGKVMRVVPKDNESLNETWISDRDRFSYTAVHHEDRLLLPKIKKEGIWYTVSWLEALEFSANLIQNVAKTHPEQIGALLSPNATLEESYLIQKLMRSLQSHNIDHRLRQTDFNYQVNAAFYPGISVPIQELEFLNAVLIVGSDIRKENPILGLKLRKAALKKAKVLAINPIDVEMNFSLSGLEIVPQGDLVLGLATLVKAGIQQKITSSEAQNLERFQSWLTVLKDVSVTEKSEQLLQEFLVGDKRLILLGALAEQHPYYSDILWLAQIFSEMTGAKIGLVTAGANAAGCWQAGAIPHRTAGGVPVSQPGLNAKQMLEKTLKQYVLWNIDPELDCAEGIEAYKTLSEAQSVISITAFESQSLEAISTVMLPLSAFTENEGTFCNCEGKWQTFESSVPPMGESRPGWKILRVLGNVLGLEAFEYQTCAEVLQELTDKLIPTVILDWQISIPKELHYISQKSAHGVIKIAQIPLYASDNLVRRAMPLQKMSDRGIVAAQLNSALHKTLQIQSHVEVSYQKQSLKLPVIVNDRIPDNTISIPMALPETLVLGGSYVDVEVKPC